MTDHFRVIVIGGGVVGCNILYHLAKAGWSDVALCERAELTSGATWHSSGNISLYARNRVLCDLALHTFRMLQPLQEEAEADIGLTLAGSLRLGTDETSLAENEQFHEVFTSAGLNAQIVDPGCAAELWPLMNPEGIVNALHLPEDSYLNPADFTQALAKVARARGARVFRNTPVIGVSRTNSGEWAVETTQGTMTCEHIVSATGIFSRRSPLPIDGILPVATVSHQYMLTAPIAQLAGRAREGLARLPILRQPSARMNIREEGQGFLISLYEANAKAIYPNGPPADLGMELLPPDFETIENEFGAATARVPCLETAGIKDVVHGPLPWSPDFAPMLGPVRGLENVWLAEGVSYGVSWSGGVADILTNWIVHGDPGRNVLDLDCNRLGFSVSRDEIDRMATAAYTGSFTKVRTKSHAS